MEPTLHIPNPNRDRPNGRRTTMFVVGALVAVFALAGVAIGIFRTGSPVNTALTSSASGTTSQPTSVAGAPPASGTQQAPPPPTTVPGPACRCGWTWTRSTPTPRWSNLD